MAALGLAFGQLGIGATIYSEIVDMSVPDAVGQRIQHVVANSTIFPVKELGHQPASVTGTIEVEATALAAFITGVRTGTSERKISFVVGTVECYVYAYSGDLPSIVCINPYGSDTRLYNVAFSFPLSRSKVYKASDDSVLWGS